MIYCSRSVRSSHDEDKDTLLGEKLDTFNNKTDTAETKEVWLPPDTNRYTSKLSTGLYLLIRALCNMGWLLFALLPTFIQGFFERDSIQSKADILHPTAYLDGMRGLAAFAVFLCHLSYSTFDIGHVWGAGEDQEIIDRNKNLLQLPIVRLLYSGPPMVAIFFVISGYALSYKALKQMHKRDFEGLMTTLASSLFRRALRLFLPCFVSTLLVVCLVRVGLYKLTEDFANGMRAVHEQHYWTAPDMVTQLSDWFYKMLDFVNAFDWSLYSGSIDIDPHLWTIPVEFRCSMALFLTHVLVAKMSLKMRHGTLVFLLGWGTYWNRWEMVPFWAGMLIAELELRKAAHVEELKGLATKEDDGCAGCRSIWRTCLDSIALIVGLFLASYPDADGHASPGYVWLTELIPERYDQKHRFWANIGAILIVWSVGNLPFLRRLFTSEVLQYLGKISFPLYVCHGLVIHTFTYLTLDWIWSITNGYEEWSQFVQGFALVALCTIILTIWISDIFLRVVDIRCVKFAKWLEGKLLSQ